MSRNPGTAVRPLPGPRWVWSAVALVCVAAGLGLRAWVETSPLPGERHVATTVEQTYIGLRFEYAQLFDLLGRPLYAAPFLGIAMWLLLRGVGARAALFVGFATAGLIANAALKQALGVTPLWAELRGPAAGFNFPSGHVFYAVVFAGSLAWLAVPYRRWDLIAIAVTAIVLMGPARVLDGVHLISDVIAGYLFGLAWLALSIGLFSGVTRVSGTAAVRRHR